jgi:hypothetical protein
MLFSEISSLESTLAATGGTHFLCLSLFLLSETVRPTHKHVRKERRRLGRQTGRVLIIAKIVRVYENQIAFLSTIDVRITSVSASPFIHSIRYSVRYYYHRNSVRLFSSQYSFFNSSFVEGESYNQHKERRLMRNCVVKEISEANLNYSIKIFKIK